MVSATLRAASTWNLFASENLGEKMKPLLFSAEQEVSNCVVIATSRQRNLLKTRVAREGPSSFYCHAYLPANLELAAVIASSHPLAATT